MLVLRLQQKQMSFTLSNPQNFVKEKICEDDKNSAATSSSIKSYKSSFQYFEPISELPMRKRRSTHPKRKFAIKDFKLLKHLGKGRFGQVYLAAHLQTGFICAIKIILKSSLNGQNQQQTKKLKNQMISQIKIQSFMDHPNIVKLYSFFDDHQKIYLLMEIATDGHLFDIICKHEKLTQGATSFLLKQVLSGLSYMHENHIIHRDLKLENLILTYDTLKICDFGWSVYCNFDFRSTLCGTPLYFPPQILRGQLYNDKVDTWAVGTLAHELLTGQNPFKIKKENQMSRIVTQKFVMGEGSRSSQQFISSALEKDPDSRSSAKDMINHPFIKKYQNLFYCQELCKLSQLKKRKKYST